MKKAQIEHWRDEQGGPMTEEAFVGRLNRMGYAVSRYTYPPGTRFPEHSHGVDKIDVVLRGRFLMTMYGESLLLEAGDSVVVPRGVVHSAEVVGDEPVVSLDAVKQR